MTNDTGTEPTGRAGWTRTVAAHPVLTVLMAAFTVGGAILGHILLGEEADSSRRELLRH